MKKLILSAAIIVAAISANAQTPTTNASTRATPKAQKPFQVNIGLETALPLSDFADFYSFGFGGSAEGVYNVDPTLALTLNAGLIHFSGKDYSNAVYTLKGQSLSIVPVLAGIKYSFTPKVYGSAQLGTGIFLKDKDNSASKTTSSFAYAPGIGYRFSDNFDALLKYQAYSKKNKTTDKTDTNGTIGLRLAYTF